MAAAIELSEDAACAVYRTLSGGTTALSAVVDDTRAARRRGEAPGWRVPVTSRTVPRLGALYLLACDEKASFEFGQADTLSAREHAFLQDFTDHRLRRAGEKPARLVTRIARQATAVSLELFRVCSAVPRLLAGRVPDLPERLREVVIIGAYGGDHVGDAAILGGVLLSLHERYGVTSANVLSHRPGHTHRLAAALSTPVDVSVHQYDAPTARRLTASADAVVFAGGPLMDLPRVLVRHLVVAASARARGIPLVVERVGIGPFKRNTSVRLARLLLRQATRISTRSSACAGNRVARGLGASVGPDPAFDYLATRGQLSRLTSAEKQSVDELLAETEGRLVVGVNVRPIRHARSTRGASYSKHAEGRFIRHLADALQRLPALVSRPVTYVFFPMNPIQFGMSDLASAYRIHRLVGREVDFRVWEADPDVDGVLYMLRHCHMALAMRLHACIFAMSQDLPVVGVDYYPGQGGKVERLFRDLGRDADVRVVDTVTAEWLVERLTRHQPNQA